MTSTPVLQIAELCKTFTLHAQGGARIPVLDGVNLTVYPGECVMLDGPSGSGKSTLLRSIYTPTTSRKLDRFAYGIARRGWIWCGLRHSASCKCDSALWDM